MKPQTLDLSLVTTSEPEWFHLLDDATEAIRFKLKAVDGIGGSVWDVFERTEIGFCYRGQCVGGKASEAFSDFAKKQNASFTVTIKVEF